MKRTLLNSWAVAALLLCSQGGYAEDWKGKDWMGNLPDNAYVARLSIPGTHDTATGEGFIVGMYETYSRAQDLSLADQLEDGIRAFDFRPSEYNGYLNCAHGISETNITFQKAFETLRDFLVAHPTEFFIIHILQVDAGNTTAQNLLHELLESDGMKDYVVDFRRDLTVEDMRGKMLLLYRDAYEKNPVGGMMTNWCGWIDWNAQTNGVITGAGSGPEAKAALYMQDQADTHEDGMVDAKVNAIRKMLDFSTTHIVNEPRQLVWVYNFASAYSKVGAFDASLSDGYRDNATHTNAAIIDYLKDESNVAGPAGIVLMDYAGVAESNGYATRGDELVDALIEQNFKYIYGSSGEQPETSVVVSFKRDNDRDYTKKMGVEGKNGVPLLADFDGNGLTDVYFGGEGYLWDASLKDGAGDWTWADGGYLGYNNGAGSTPAWNALSHTSVSSTDDDLPVFYGGLGSRVLDYDQDGMPDLLLLDATNAGWTSVHPNVGRSALRVVHNNGGQDGLVDVTAQMGGLSGWTQLSENSGRGNAGNPLHSISVADVNMDGWPDVLFQTEKGDPWARVTKLFLNQGGSTFAEDTESRLIPANGGAVLFGDFNNDGYPDAVVSGYANAGTLDDVAYTEGNRLDFYKNDGKGHLAWANTDLNEDVNWTSAQYGHSGDECVMYVIDYDQDGKQDILIIGSFGCSGNYAEANNKAAVVLRNVSTDGKFAFEPMKAGIWPTSANPTRMSALADFNGDGYPDYMACGWGGPNADNTGYDWVPSYCSYSTGKGTFETVWNVMDGGVEEGFMNYADVDGDGMLDFMSACNGDNGAPYFYRNTSLLATGGSPQVPGAPTGLKSAYDPATKRLTLTWDKMATASGSKAVYNVYIVRDGKTFMRCPAVKETGSQTACTPFAAYLPSETCFFENVEPGVYEVGVQSVAYSWNASAFSTLTVAVLDENSEVEIGADAYGADVTLSRTLKAGKWNTFCVPFSLTAEQTAAAGLGEVKAFRAVEKGTDAYELLFEDATTIEAGKPYMVRPAQAVSSIAVQGVDLVAGEPEGQTIDGVTLQGVYAPMTLSGSDKYFISDNVFYQADRDIEVKGYRAYIALGAGEAQVNRIVIKGDTETSVGGVDADGESLVDVYTIGGVKLKEGVREAQALDGLPRGVYVVGGQGHARKVMK